MSTLASILQFIYDITHWQYFGIFLITWILIDLVRVPKWKALLERMHELITKPWIFDEDENPKEPPLYPRTILEQLASIKFKDSTESSKPIFSWIDQLAKNIFDTNKPLHTFGYVIALALFVVFLLADAITVAATLDLLGVISLYSLPTILSQLEIAIIGGALLSTVVPPKSEIRCFSLFLTISCSIF